MTNFVDRDAARAGAVMERLLDGTAVAVDPGGGARQLRDLDIVLSSGRRIAVEATRYTVPAMTEQNRLVSKYDQHMPGLMSTWIVGAPRGFSVKKFRSRLVPLLNSVDVGEPQCLNVCRDPMDEDIRSHLKSLRIRYVIRVSPAGLNSGGRIILNSPPEIGVADADLITDAVDHCVARPDNVAKLNVPDAESRALFVWVDSSKAPHSVAMWGEAAPRRIPRLPDPIDEVWIATATRPAVLWTYSDAYGWGGPATIAEQTGH